MSQAEQDRLLMSEPALTAFITAEMRHFLTAKSKQSKFSKWELSTEEKLKMKFINDDMLVINEEYATAKENMTTAMAIDLLCNTTQAAFFDGYTNEQGLLSALGSAILFFKNFFHTCPRHMAAC